MENIAEAEIPVNGFCSISRKIIARPKRITSYGLSGDVFDITIPRIELLYFGGIVIQANDLDARTGKLE